MFYPSLAFGTIDQTILLMWLEPEIPQGAILFPTPTPHVFQFLCKLFRTNDLKPWD